MIESILLLFNCLWLRIYLPRKWLRILSDFGYLSRFERDQKIRQIIYISVISACPVDPEDRTGMNSSDHRERAKTKLYR